MIDTQPRAVCVLTAEQRLITFTCITINTLPRCMNRIKATTQRELLCLRLNTCVCTHQDVLHNSQGTTKYFCVSKVSSCEELELNTTCWREKHPASQGRGSGSCGVGFTREHEKTCPWNESLQRHTRFNTHGFTLLYWLFLLSLWIKQTFSQSHTYFWCNT